MSGGGGGDGQRDRGWKWWWETAIVPRLFSQLHDGIYVRECVLQRLMHGRRSGQAGILLGHESRQSASDRKHLALPNQMVENEAMHLEKA